MATLLLHIPSLFPLGNNKDVFPKKTTLAPIVLHQEPSTQIRALLLEKGESSNSTHCLIPSLSPIIENLNEPLLISFVPLLLSPSSREPSSMARHSIMVDKIAEALTGSSYSDHNMGDSTDD